MGFPFVGVDPPADAIGDREAFVLFETAPSKQDKAALKRALQAKYKLAHQGRAMAIAMGTADPGALRGFLEKAHALQPIALALHGFRSSRRTRSRAHRDALEQAVPLLRELEGDLESTKNTISRRFATGLLFELWVGEHPLGENQLAHLAETIEHAASDRRRDLGMALVNEPERVVGMLDAIVWDEADALTGSSEVVDRVLSWGEDLAGVHLEVALKLAARIGDALPAVDLAPRTIANAAWLAYRAGLLADASVAARAERWVTAVGAEGSYGFVYGDLRRCGDDERFVALASRVLPEDAAKLYDAGCWTVSRSTELALDIFDRACRAPDPPWQAPNNGIAMLLTVYPRDVPAPLVELWRARIAACDEAPARHNYACLLARLGEAAAARDALVEAIAGGADLEPIAGDRELVAVLDDPAVVAALDARVSDEGERARFEAMRLLALGREDEAIEALVAAAKAGMDPNELKYGDAFEALQDHPGMKRVRKPPKRKKR